MESIIFRASGVCKDYGRSKVLNDVSFTIEKGKIYGFVGHNGAGKTTMMRIMAGLCQPSSGVIEYYGQSDAKSIQSLRHKIGFMIERPILYDDFDAKENLVLQMKLLGMRLDQQRVNDLLNRVGLGHAGDKKTKDFSLGMKQRLGIAMALVSSPDLLVLDEPVNGLDPKGMVEVRNLLSGLCHEDGITIILSSHILHEMYQLATDYIFIHKGKLVDILSADELKGRCKSRIKISCSERDKLIKGLKSAYGDFDYGIEGTEGIKIFSDSITALLVGQVIAKESIVVHELSTSGESLEQFYLTITGGHYA